MHPAGETQSSLYVEPKHFLMRTVVGTQQHSPVVDIHVSSMETGPGN